jgi:hypothetical protein
VAKLQERKRRLPVSYRQKKIGSKAPKPVPVRGEAFNRRKRILLAQKPGAAMRRTLDGRRDYRPRPRIAAKWFMIASSHRRRPVVEEEAESAADPAQALEAP